MSKDTQRRRLPKQVLVAAMAVGVGAGSYGVATAATGSTSGSTTASAPTASAPSAQKPWAAQRSDETLLTGDTASKVRAAALARVPGATVVRVETDADGHAAYEAHLIESDGTPATVYVDEQFYVVSVETR